MENKLCSKIISKDPNQTILLNFFFYWMFIYRFEKGYLCIMHFLVEK